MRNKVDTIRTGVVVELNSDQKNRERPKHTAFDGESTYYKSIGTSFGFESEAEPDSFYISATSEFQFDQVVTRGDTRISRSVEWSFECSETADSTDAPTSTADADAESTARRGSTDGGVDWQSAPHGGDGGTALRADRTSSRGDRVRARWYAQAGGPVETTPVVRNGTV
ncbi:hypothetical protein [Haladaptatus halobius]|uniref:hypothetical protein n=1 Tax=Haladaptatus halobius TaxID=2884875 RepID=UPI001D09A14B|nr:hypothetical protein [Haladaptatus halobius]